MLSGPGGDARANAISRLATSSVGAEPAARLFAGGKGARHSNAAASQQAKSKGFSVRRKAATKEQSSTHAAKQERTLRRSRTPATVETSITRDPTESIAICVLVIAHHP